MRKKRKEINSLMYVWKQGKKGKREEKNVFLLPLFGLPYKMK